MPTPPLNAVNAAYHEARARDPTCTSFVLQEAEYRLTVLPDEPAVAWDVWVSNVGGDVVVDKGDGEELVRPTQTDNEGYRMVSVLRSDASGPDPYLRRRVHTWVAAAFLDPAPTPSALVEHQDDDGSNNDASNLAYGTYASNRRRKHMNDRTGYMPPHKVKKVMLRTAVVRVLKMRTGLRGRHLAAFIENLITRELEPHTEYAQRR